MKFFVNIFAVTLVTLNYNQCTIPVSTKIQSFPKSIAYPVLTILGKRIVLSGLNLQCLGHNKACACIHECTRLPGS